MINGKKILALVPARKDSKGLPNKNIKVLCSKPMIQWTIESAIESKFIDLVVVSTDSEEIAEISRKSGAEVPFLRPKELATDTATSVEVVKHALEFLENSLNQEYQYLVLLEPTSPLRKANDIDTMIQKLENLSEFYDAIVSVGEVKEHPSNLKIIQGDSLVSFRNDLETHSRRQDNLSVYFPYGVAYIIKVDTFKEELTFYPNRCTYYEIDSLQCFEVDDLGDFLIVELVLRMSLGEK